jgi:diguanylate cyclase (GGDEF)-like protein
MRKNVIPVKDLPNEKVNIIEDPILGSSLRDPVTNLFNKNFLEETLASELQRSLRRQKIIGVIRLEVDDFENIVKTYSSSVSDMLLKKIAEYLRESIRASDVACRLDDQEFILVMNGVSRDLTLERAEHLRVNAKNIKLKYEDQTFDGIKLSLGVAVYPEHGTTVKALLENTEVALRLARSDGGNRVVVYQKNLE